MLFKFQFYNVLMAIRGINKELNSSVIVQKLYLQLWSIINEDIACTLLFLKAAGKS